jgi:adenylate kinase family enzyme
MAEQQGKLKFIFLAGAPGSGKTYQIKQILGKHIGAEGMHLISADDIYEKLLEKYEYPKDLTQIEDEQERQWVMSDDPEAPRGKARKLMKYIMGKLAKRGTGMIYDGTGQQVTSYTWRKEDMEDLGYDCSMVYVDVPVDVALDRNADRDRKLPDDKVFQIWQAVRRNKPDFERLFGKDMHVVDNSQDGPANPEIVAAIQGIINAPVKNPIGQEFLSTGKRPAPKPKVTHYAPMTHYPEYVHPNDVPHELPGKQKSFYHPDDWNDRWFKKDKGKETPKKTKSSMWDDADFEGDSPYKDDDIHPDLDKYNGGQSSLSGMLKKSFGWLGPQVYGSKKPMNDPQHPGGNNPDNTNDPQNPNIGQETLYNPITGNEIMVKSALGYPPDHPARIEAERMKQKAEEDAVMRQRFIEAQRKKELAARQQNADQNKKGSP